MTIKTTRVLLAVSLLALVCAVNELDYREQKKLEQYRAEHEQARFFTPYGQADCRRPLVATETRVYVEWCQEAGKCWRSCSIQPRHPEASRHSIIQRAIRS